MLCGVSRVAPTKSSATAAIRMILMCCKIISSVLLGRLENGVVCVIGKVGPRRLLLSRRITDYAGVIAEPLFSADKRERNRCADHQHVAGFGDREHHRLGDGAFRGG